MYPTARRLLWHCDAVLRLPGESTGADQDVAIARERGLPVYHRIEDVPGHRPDRPGRDAAGDRVRVLGAAHWIRFPGMGMRHAGAPAGLLLAAGEGRRLGTPKALVEIDGERLANRGVRMLHEAGCTPVVVVTGAAPVAVPGAVVVHNPDWHTGMASSLRAGLAALAPDCPAVVIALVDQPRVTAEAVRRLRAAYDAGAGVAVATYEGRPRNPVLIARAHFAEVAAEASGDVGARDFLRARPDLVVPVPCDDVAGPEDIDTPEDLRRFTEDTGAGDANA